MRIKTKTGDDKMARKNKSDMEKQIVRVIALAVAVVMVILVLLEVLVH